MINRFAYKTSQFPTWLRPLSLEYLGEYSTALRARAGSVNKSIVQLCMIVKGKLTFVCETNVSFSIPSNNTHWDSGYVRALTEGYHLLQQYKVAHK